MTPAFLYRSVFVSKRVFFVAQTRKIYKNFIFNPRKQDCFLENALKCTVILYQKTMQTIGFHDENHLKLFSAGVKRDFRHEEKRNRLQKRCAVLQKFADEVFLKVASKVPHIQNRRKRCAAFSYGRSYYDSGRERSSESGFRRCEIVSLNIFINSKICIVFLKWS